jgi:hypothetical protein
MMTGVRLVLFTSALTSLLAAGCVSQQPQARSAAIGDRVTLRVAESVTIEPRNVVLQFSEVVADSRCPADVVCVWEGDAEVSIRAVAADGTSSDLRLHTKGDAEAAPFAGLALRIVALEPVPLEGKPPRQADYVLTLEVAQAN